MSIRAPRPTRIATRPSVIGPTSPSDRPPGSCGFLRYSTYRTIEFNCWGVNVPRPKTGMFPGPVRTASPTSTGVAPCRVGASLPTLSAPPLPAALWHAAQLSRYSSPPSWRSPGGLCTSGMGGPGPSDATYATRSSISARVYGERLVTDCRSGAVFGMRPVDSWKSAAAAPTPRRSGPCALPSPFAPWQVAHPTRKSRWPRSALPGSRPPRCSVAPAVCRPIASSPAASKPPSDATTSRPDIPMAPSSPDDEDRGEQADPDDVDEVPVVPDRVDRRAAA